MFSEFIRSSCILVHDTPLPMGTLFFCFALLSRDFDIAFSASSLPQAVNVLKSFTHQEEKIRKQTSAKHFAGVSTFLLSFSAKLFKEELELTVFAPPHTCPSLPSDISKL